MVKTTKHGVRDLNGTAMSIGLVVPATGSEPPTARQLLARIQREDGREDGREDIMEHFSYDHLPAGPMREMSRMFADLAEHAHANAPRCAERSAGLRKILEAKDCLVRAVKPRRTPL